ncbi:Retrovirus-related Pol polyprotein from transposon TNT 1-94 [Artemisia annua]|uniref:Retrovirus-related Pol polyprotein from transposon TNT 1-94 n=1 Tax=Artemisia annua TaxID=35608 RepID=A0A2U1Q935_ARTAN|nr:Retrovirus-related Pol polyprotein from transposon TNT 1-94 [Artemisia annua]
MVNDIVDKPSTSVDPTFPSRARPVLTNARLAVEVFDGTCHFGMWQSEVLDVLFQQGLDIAIEESKPEDVEERNWLTINRFNQLVTDLMNMDEVFKDKDLALILLGSLPEEYELLETTLLNEKDDVSLSEVCVALYRKELRRKDKQISSSGDAEVLLVRGRSQKKGTDKRWRSKSRQRLSKDECAFCHEKGVRYSPKLKKNLIPVGTLESKGFEGRTVVGTITAVTDGDRNSEAMELWHMCLGHAGEKSLNLIIKQGLLKGVSSCKLDLCEHWINGKTTRVKFRTTIHKTQDKGSVIKWKKMMETQTCRKIKHLRTDNGEERRHCQTHFTVRHTPQQNGVAERMNRTLLEKVRCMLSNAGLGKEFWAEVVTYECHLVNRLPSTTIDGKTPFEKWYGKPATDYDSLHVFGSAAYYHVKESKLDPRAKKALFMGITFRIKGYQNEKWRIAMREEMQSLEKNQTWELTNLPKGKKAIECKWVYAKKEGFPSQDNVRYKAILVAKGCAQKDGIDYNDIFSPVVKHSSIRILLALVAQLDLELVQIDVKTAFLHGDLEEEIYMVQPEGFKVAGKEYEQSPRQWYTRFDKFMMDSKYTRSKYDHCVYLKKLQDGSFVYLLLYVDDMLIASQSLDEIEKLKTRLKSEFEMKDLREAKMILGMEIIRDRKLRKLCLTQKQYLRRILKRFRFDKQTKRVSTPLASQFKISAAMSPKNDAEKAYMKKVPYANAVGSLMYAMICTQPDISHAIGMVSRYMHNPGKGHWQAVKCIFKYIHNTVDVGLVFKHGGNQWVEGYCDSDYVGDLDKRRPTTGYVFTLAKAPVSWKSTLQSNTALSTVEAEYMAMTEAVKEGICLQELLGELGIKQKFITMHSDSQSVIHLTKNQVYHARTKHIDVRYHFIQEILEVGGVRI